MKWFRILIIALSFITVFGVLKDTNEIIKFSEISLITGMILTGGWNVFVLFRGTKSNLNHKNNRPTKH